MNTIENFLTFFRTPPVEGEIIHVGTRVKQITSVDHANGTFEVRELSMAEYLGA